MCGSGCLRRVVIVDNLDDVRWTAVEARDRRSDGVFVYAVRSTGVFCRPGCGARRAMRRNVEFFSTPEAAISAGYRACRRCRPDLTRTTDPVVASVIAACRWLEQPGDAPDVASIAARFGWSQRHAHRIFIDVVGVPIGRYRRAQQAERARQALRSGLPVTDAIYAAGYGSSRAFYEHGAPRLGMAPARYRSGAHGEAIGYTSVATPIGLVVAASTAKGVCAVRIGAGEDALVAALRAEFPGATVERREEKLAGVAEVLAGAVRGDGRASALPLDIAGTAFQARVWEALRSIPAGETRSYSEVAEQIGAPLAVRAVGSACGANPVALAIPCHRVVRRDGSLGGYRWGLEIKTALLDAETERPAGRSEH